MEPTLPHQQQAENSNKLFQIFIFVLWIVVLVALATATYITFIQKPGVQDEERTTSSLQNVGTINLGVGLWPGNIGFYIADKKGFFRDEGLDVNLKVYESLGEESKDYSEGRLHGRGNLTLDAIKEAQNGINHKVVLGVDYSNGADGIIASSSVKSFKDLKGKKVAFEAGTIEEFFFLYALEQNNMTLKDVVGVDLDPEKSAEALINGEVEAAVTYEPFLSEAKTKTNGNMVFSSGEAQGLIMDILTFKTDFIEQNPEAMQALIKAYYRGLDYVKTNPDESHAIAAEVMKDTKENVAAQLKTLLLLSPEENKTAFTFAPGLQSIYANLRKSSDFLEAQGQGDEKLDVDKMVEPRFVKDYR